MVGRLIDDWCVPLPADASEGNLHEMTPGALLQQVRSRLRGGPKATWYREVVRPSILDAAPLQGTADTSMCEVHILTSGQDWLNACWALRSFYQASGCSYALSIHDDGTLPVAGRHALQQQFPDARLLSRSQTDAEIGSWLAPYPRCFEFRSSNKLALKIFDLLYYGRSKRLMLLDSDVLFFSYPAELLRRIEDPLYQVNCANADIASAYTVTVDVVRRQCGFTPIERFNSGLCLIHRQSLRLSWLEEFLTLPGILSHFWQIEQTLLALSSSRFGTELLPPEYALRLDAGIENRPCKHYVGAVREAFYSEGIATLHRHGVLRQAVDAGALGRETAARV
jgi:hypothetical protein